MSLSPEKMQRLMAYADGELEGAEREEAEKLLAADDEAARFVDQVAGLGAFVKVGHAARSGKAIAAFDVADLVMAKVADAKPDAKVASLAVAREAKKNRAPLVGVALTALALAASVFFLARPDEMPMGQGKPVAVNHPQVPAEPGSPAVEVSAVESPGQTVNVFYLPSGNELSTSVVVWVDETGEK